MLLTSHSSRPTLGEMVEFPHDSPISRVWPGRRLPMRALDAGTIFCVALTSFLGTAALAAEIEFNRDVRPILSDNCLSCHGPDVAAREADLRLDREDAAKADRGGYFAILPGKALESDLIRRITSDDPDNPFKKYVANGVQIQIAQQAEVPPIEVVSSLLDVWRNRPN